MMTFEKGTVRVKCEVKQKRKGYFKLWEQHVQFWWQDRAWQSEELINPVVTSEDGKKVPG